VRPAVEHRIDANRDAGVRSARPERIHSLGGSRRRQHDPEKREVSPIANTGGGHPLAPDPRTGQGESTPAPGSRAHERTLPSEGVANFRLLNITFGDPRKLRFPVTIFVFVAWSGRQLSTYTLGTPCWQWGKRRGARVSHE
jgi:hypothetical protein